MTADGWIRWYYSTRNSIGSMGAPGLNYVDSTGRMHAKQCACGCKKKHGTKDGHWVCGHCGAPWVYVDRFIFKGEVQKSLRNVGLDSTNSRFFDVSALLGKLLTEDPWDGKLYVANCMGYSHRELVVKFPALYPEAPGPFSKGSIQRRIESARRKWDQMLREANIAVSVY